MPQSAVCPGCGSQLEIDGTMGGLKEVACPACGTSITFAQAIQESEFAFPCRFCGKRLGKQLRMPWVVIPSLLATLWISTLYGVGWQLGATVVALLVVITLVALLFGRVYFARPDMMDRSLGLELKSRNSKDDFSGD